MFEAADAARVRAARRPKASAYASVFEGRWRLRNPPQRPRPEREDRPLRAAALVLVGERPERRAAGLLGARGGVPVLRRDRRRGRHRLHGRRPPRHRRADRALASRLAGGRPAPRTSRCRHQGRSLRTRAAPDPAGGLGQFRTPRHVIRAMVRLVDPRLGETVYDPAAGTAGFLVGAYDHIRLANSSPDGVEEVEAEGKMVRRGLGDTLSRDAVRRLHEATFFGNDVDPQMVRLATMNLTLRGLDRVRLLRRDALTRALDRAAKAELGLPAQGFDVILANPPFSGRLDRDRIVEEVKVGRTAQTELLFLQYMLNHLKEGGRCGRTRRASCSGRTVPRCSARTPSTRPSSPAASGTPAPPTGTSNAPETRCIPTRGRCSSSRRLRRVTKIEFPGDGGFCIEARVTVTGSVNCARDEVGNLNSISLLSSGWRAKPIGNGNVIRTADFSPKPGGFWSASSSSTPRRPAMPGRGGSWRARCTGCGRRFERSKTPVAGRSSCCRMNRGSFGSWKGCGGVGDDGDQVAARCPAIVSV